MIRRLLILIGVLLTVGAGAAGAQSAATWNHGYSGWWPGGFGYPPVTVQATGYPCSVTANGPTFHSYTREWRMDYGAGTSCRSGVGVKTLTVAAQVLGQDGHTWHTITGSPVTYGPGTLNPLRVIRTRPVYLGHVYRTIATATLVVPNGHAGCSLTNSCIKTIAIKAISRPLAP
jgi:hypothetical protein